MVPQRWHASLILLVSVWKACAFSYHASPTSIITHHHWSSSRGGGENDDAAAAVDEENRDMDEYIDDLVSTVSDDDDDDEEQSSLEAIETEDTILFVADDEVELAVNDQVDEQDNDENVKEDSGDAMRLVGTDKGTEVIVAPDEKSSRRKRRTKGAADELPSDAKVDVNHPALPEAHSVAPPHPPNALYRFLLHQGRIGHVLVMFIVLVVEFVKTYLPPVAHLLGFLTSYWRRDDVNESEQRRGLGRGSSAGQSVAAQYSAFVSSDGTSVRGRKGKEQVKKADEQAMQKLRQVGSIQDAKFRHVSIDFMKRHQIGPYRDLVGSEQVVGYKEAGKVRRASDDEEESDVDWVVEALVNEDEDDDEEKEPARRIDTTFGVDVGSDGTSVSVGVSFGSKSKKKKRKTRLVQAVTSSTSSRAPPKRPAGPRSSDKDGGGGVLGRIRAAGANSLVSRSLLGAYPGDAVPPREAASANGVISLARKYGYGDWSSDDDNHEGDDTDPFRPPHKKTYKKKKKRPQPSVTFEFGVSSGSGSKQRSKSAVSTARPSSTKRKEPQETTEFNERSQVLSGSTLSKQPRVQARPPMATLNEKIKPASPTRTLENSRTKASSTTTTRELKRPDIRDPFPRPRVPVRPAMQTLRKKKDNADTE